MVQNIMRVEKDVTHCMWRVNEEANDLYIFEDE